MKYYAVFIPEAQRGVYTSWAECKRCVHGIPRARYKRFKNRRSARYFSKHGTQRPRQDSCLTFLFDEGGSVWRK